MALDGKSDSSISKAPTPPQADFGNLLDLHKIHTDSNRGQLSDDNIARVPRTKEARQSDVELIEKKADAKSAGKDDDFLWKSVAVEMAPVAAIGFVPSSRVLGLAASVATAGFLVPRKAMDAEVIRVAPGRIDALLSSYEIPAEKFSSIQTQCAQEAGSGFQKFAQKVDWATYILGSAWIGGKLGGVLGAAAGGAVGAGGAYFHDQRHAKAGQQACVLDKLHGLIENDLTIEKRLAKP